MYQHADATYSDVKAKLMAHLRDLFPVEGKRQRLLLKDLVIRDDADPGDYAAQKDARMTGRTWSVPVTAVFELREGNRLVDRARMRIIDLPRLTNRGSYIVGGSEYMFPTQKRLRSGPYVRTGENDELRCFFNMRKGRNFHLGIHSEKGHFQFQVDTSKNIPLYPVLRALGVSDQAMERAWGREALATNMVRDQSKYTKALKTVFEKMSYGREAPTPDALAPAVAELFAATEMDAENSELTIGKKIGRATGEALLLASAKMLRVGRGEEHEDNRDSLIHNDIVDLSDFIVERFRDRQFRDRIARTIRFNIDRRDKVSGIISRDAFQRPVDSLFTESQLSQSPLQTNPLGMLSDYTAVTVRGEGGIQQDNALTRGVRALDPSHLGFLDPAHTPEGSGVGTTLHLTTGARKRGRDLVTRVIDVRTGKETEITPVQAWKATVAFPEAVDPRTRRLRRGLRRVKASHRGSVATVPVAKVDYAFIMPEHLMDANTATIPFTSHNNGARVMLASKLGVQAKPLVDPDKPLVQSGTESGTVEKAVGAAFSPRAPVAGRVEKVTDDYIQIAGRKVSIPNYFPLNSNNFMHATPRVKVGDRVVKGQVLADTNYTRDGELAQGKNLSVAYVPYKGMNVEDGVVISRSAAAKMTSEHLYQQPYMFDADTILDKKRFRAYFPAKVSDEQATKLDDRGVIKKGQEIEPGDFLVLSMRKSAPGTESQRLAAISRILAKEYRDDSLTWDKDVSGVVQDVAWRQSEVVVHVRTKEPMRVGDKIVGRYANKGIVVHIVPDDEMPRDEKDQPVDMLMNPNGVVSRMNLGQIMETTASRIAEKTGKPFVARGFGDNSAERITRELKKHGLKDHQSLFDPIENQSIPNVLVGKQYIYKLEHQATKKISARGGGADEVYTDDEQPVRGKEGGRGVGNMELYALLAHGALANVHEMYGVKSSFDPDVWKAVEDGAPLPPPRPAFSQHKFAAMLKGMGIQMQEDKRSVAVVPFLDRHLKQVTNGEITDHKLLRGKDLKEEKNGLFDTKKTGGVRGERWSHIRLPEPLPNPTFERAILSLLHLKKTEFDDVLAGRRQLNGETGGRAIRSALNAINVKKRLAQAREQAKTKTGSELNALHRETRYLKALDEQGLKPGEYVIDNVPVLPPRFRPVYPLPDGNLNVSDLNFHYQGLLQLSSQAKDMKGREFAAQRQKLVPELYKAVGGVMGLNEGVVERPRPPKGIAKVIGGAGSPKGGYLHSRMLKRRQDISATNVIVANPKLGIDELGLPEATAWKTFRPFLIRELRGHGLTPLQAKKEIDDKTPRARRALEKVVSERHVIINRAPTLHKFSVMAFKPRLVSGYALEIPPLIVGGFNADFDGNCIAGWSKVCLTFAAKHRKLSSITDVEEDYGMKFDGSTRITCVHENGDISVEMEIRDVPYLEDTHAFDKHGASVFRTPDGIRVWSYDHKTGEPVMAEVTGLTIEDDCPVADIKTRRGYEVTASTNESMCVFDHETGEVVDRCPRDVIGAIVPVARILPVNGSEHDHDFGWMLGSFVSDGFFTGGGIGYTKLDDGKRERFHAQIKRVQDGKYRRSSFYDDGVSGDKYGPSAKDHYYDLSDEVMGLFSDCYEPYVHERDDGKRSSLRKKLPDMSAWSQDALWGLMNGLLDGDGSLSVSHAKKKPQALASFSTSSPFLADDIVRLGKRLGIRISKTEAPPRGNRHASYTLSISTVDLQRHVHRLAPMTESAREAVGLLASSEPLKDDIDIVPVPKWIMDVCASRKGPMDARTQRSLATIKSKTKPFFNVSRRTAEKMAAAMEGTEPEKSAAWRRLVASRNTTWDIITEAEDAGSIQVFDLIVPETKVFVANDGLVVWDTMGIHVPLTAEANAEAAKMVPSKHLYKPGSKKLQPKIEHEYVLGLFKISRPGPVSSKVYGSAAEVLSDLRARKIEPNTAIGVRGLGSTTPGRVLINEALPVKLRDYNQIWTDKAIQKKLVQVDKAVGRQAFVRTLQAWADIGRRYAYLTGSSFLLSDLQAMGKQRNAAYARADAQAQRIRMGGGSEEDKKRKIVELYMGVSGKLAKGMDLKPNASGDANNIGDMMNAGARGNPTQVRQMVSNIGVLLDHENKPMSEPVRGTYTEGLDSAEFFQHMYGNRKGMIDRSQSVKDPGALTKQVIVSAAGFRVSAADCGTRNGIFEPVSGATALDRYLAESVPGVGARNALVTSAMLASARAKGVKQLRVRSPMTCRAAVGVCARCYGLDEEGKPVAVGEHVGIKDAQGLTEPSTQLAMKTFHTGGVATTGKSLTTGFDRVKQLFTMPNSVQGKATLAEVGGRVDDVHARPQGGYRVVIGGRKHAVARGRKLRVKVGDRVEKGQQITDGNAQPQDVLRLRGLRQMQTHLRDEIHNVYASGGESIAHKTIEVPVRMLTETVRVSDPGDHPSLVAGDYSTYGRVDAWNRENAGKRPVRYTHQLPGSEYLPHRGDDWAKRMAHNRIQQVLTEAPAMAARSPLQGQSPFAALITGKRIEREPWEKKKDG